MRIRNETKWRTDQIAALIRRVAQDELNPRDLKSLTVVVKRGDAHGKASIGKKSYDDSWGYCPPRCGTWMSLNPDRHRTKTIRWRIFPSHQAASEFFIARRYGGSWTDLPDGTVKVHVGWELGGVDSVYLAHTIAHEMAHLRGMEHRDMKGDSRYDYSTGWRELYTWATAFPIEQKQSKPVPAPLDITSAKLNHAATMLRRAQTRMKRATTITKRWKRAVGYYERKLAAMKGGA